MGGVCRPGSIQSVSLPISLVSYFNFFRQLPTETKMFLQADKQWREVVRLIREKPTALKAVTTPGDSGFSILQYLL